jgi:hypothetical protein
MSKQAQAALYAAKHRKVWGRRAALIYAGKHSTLGLYRLASQLLAASGT